VEATIFHNEIQICVSNDYCVGVSIVTDVIPFDYIWVDFSPVAWPSLVMEIGIAHYGYGAMGCVVDIGF